MEKKKITLDVRISIIALTIAMFSLLVSIILPLMQYNYQVGRDKKNDEENISILFPSIQHSKTASFTLTKYGGILGGVQCSLVICNNSKQIVSIVDKELFLQQKSGDFIQYSKVIRNVLDSNGNQVTFPFSLEPGEAKGIILEVTTIVPNINENLESGDNNKKGVLFFIDFYAEHICGGYDLPEQKTTTFDFQELIEYLKENKLDIYGNTLVVYYNSIGVINPIYPVYKFEIVTSKGKKFEQLIRTGFTDSFALSQGPIT